MQSYVILRNPRYLMKSYETRWDPATFYENLWDPMKSYRIMWNLWTPINLKESHEIQWGLGHLAANRTIGVHWVRKWYARGTHGGSYEAPMESNGFLWKRMDPMQSCWIEWNPIRFHAIHVKSYDILWNLMRSYEILLNPTESYAVL